MRDYLYSLLFVWYPYVCLTTFLVGSLIRFDAEPYSWRAGSSQLLRKANMGWASNLFHIGILFLLLGHAVGLLTPSWLYTLVLSVEAKQAIAIAAGGIAGVICFIGLSMLLYRRLTDPRIRETSTHMDIAILGILWLQLVLGLITLPYSLQHPDGSVMIILAHWAQGIVIAHPVPVQTLYGVGWPYLAHIALGMTIFLIFPFSRLVHVWSAPVWYLGRKGYQVARTRRRLDGARPSPPPAE